MATETVATAQDIIDAVAGLGSGDTIIIEDGTYDLSASISKSSGGMPNILAENTGGAILRWSKTYTWTADGDEYYCVPDRADEENPHTPYEIPRGVFSPVNGMYRQAQSGWLPYDTSSPPLGNQFDVTALFPTPDDTTEFELRCGVAHDISAFKGSVSGSTVTVTNLLDEAQLTAFDWQSDSNYLTTARGYMVMGRQADMRPGTWRWDWANGRLYVKPFAGETVNNLRVPQAVRRGIDVNGLDSFRVAGLVLEGLNCEPHWGPVGYSDDGALRVIDCEDVELDWLTIRNTCGAGIRMKQLTDPPGNGACDGARVTGITLSGVGGQGIVVGGVESIIAGATVTDSGWRNIAAPAIVGEYATSLVTNDITVTRQPGGAFHAALNNADWSERWQFRNLTATNCMTSRIGDRGCFYVIGRRAQSGVAGLFEGTSLTITRSTPNGSGDHGVYPDEGSYGAINNLRVKGFGARLGYYNSSKTNINPASGDYDAYSGRTIFCNDPDGEITINGGALIGDIVTIDVRTSSEPVTLNGVAVMTRRGTLTNGTVDRLGSPGVIDPP